MNWNWLNSRKHQSYKYDCIDKVCDKLRHHLQLKYSYFPQQSAGSSLSLCVNFMESHFLKSNDEFGAGGGAGGRGRWKTLYRQVSRNSYLCGSKFYHAQQYSGIPITICRACFSWLKIIEQEILLIYRACFVVNRRLKSEIYYTFIPLFSSHHRLKNEIY